MLKIDVSIQPPPITYPIQMGKDLLSTALFLECLPKASAYFILCDKVLENICGLKVQRALARVGKNTELLTIPGGEEIKTRAFKEKVEDELFRRKCGRDSCLIAIGGGSVLDLIGYVAATYCRGIPYISIPTTFLAMTDASIGGKTGINLGSAKNLLGATYQPKAVIIDMDALEGLPEEELLSGLTESIKHGLIGSPPLFSFIEKKLSEIRHKDPETLMTVIQDSILVKKRIVELDEKELGLRRTLNFGHTVGHCLEALLNYKIRHGDAIAFGILVEAYFSHHMGYLSYGCFARISDLIPRILTPFALPEAISFELFYKSLCTDKKSLGGVPRFVMLQEIGKPMSFNEDYVRPIPLELLKKGFRWMKTQTVESSTAISYAALN